MFRSLRVACQLFLIYGDCADRGRRRFCHLWGSLPLAGLAPVVLVALVDSILALLLVLLSPCLHVPHALWHFVGRFEPTWASMAAATDGADR
jgi:hypothetical protein